MHSSIVDTLLLSLLILLLLLLPPSRLKARI